MSEKDPNDLSHLSPEDRDIVLRGRQFLKELEGKPPVSRALQDRVQSELGLPTSEEQEDRGAKKS